MSKLPIHEIISAYSMSPIPVGNVNREPWEVRVESRANPKGMAYAIINLGRCLSRSGTWDHEPRPSSRDDEWLAEHRFPLEEAMELARAACHTITWNGKSADEIAMSLGGPLS